MSYQPGVYAAAVTPRREGGSEIDVGAALEVIDFLCARKLQGIALMGSTGEFVHFSLEDRVRFVQLAARRSRLPLLVNISHTTLDGAVQLAQEATDSGAAGLLLMPPFYFRYDQGDIEQFFLSFLDRAGRTAPVFLYNIPVFAPALGFDIVRHLLETGQFYGIKDSGGNSGYLRQLSELRRERPFELLVGDDALLVEGREYGATGGVSGVACGLPELMSALDHAAASRDLSRRDALHTRLKEFLAWLGHFPTPVGVRESVCLRGIKIGPHASVLGPQTQQQVEQFRGWFRDWLPGVLQECASA